MAIPSLRHFDWCEHRIVAAAFDLFRQPSDLVSIWKVTKNGFHLATHSPDWQENQQVGVG
jgi:hypothetical protein